MKTYTVQFVGFGSNQLQSGIVKAKNESQVNRFIIHKYGCVSNLIINEL